MTGTNTIGYMQQCGEREKYCPRDGKQFEAGDAYCSKCGRAVGYISVSNYILPQYPTVWGQQQGTFNAQQQLDAYSQAAAAQKSQAAQSQISLDFCGNS